MKIFYSSLELVWFLIDLFFLAVITATFSTEDGQDYSLLKYFPAIAPDELYVGARDFLYRVRVGDLALLQQVPWKSNLTVQRNCFERVIDHEECRNYITVLVRSRATDTLFVCGSNAFSPECHSRDVGFRWESSLSLSLPPPDGFFPIVLRRARATTYGD